MRLPRPGLLSRIAVLFGGHYCRRVVHEQMTTGASDDFERATQMARDMVTRYGISTMRAWPMVYGETKAKFSSVVPDDAQNYVVNNMVKVDAEIQSHHRRAVRAGTRCSRRTDKVEAIHGATRT